MICEVERRGRTGACYSESIAFFPNNDAESRSKDRKRDEALQERTRPTKGLCIRPHHRGFANPPPGAFASEGMPRPQSLDGRAIPFGGMGLSESKVGLSPAHPTAG